jgi:hypothetical protein
VEALKAHNPIYRLFLMYFLWMSRMSSAAQWGVVLGGYFGARVLNQIAEDNPAARPFVYPVVIAYVLFALMSWLAQPLFNLLLRMNRFGRLALSGEQVVASNWLGGCLLAAAIALVAGLVLWDPALLLTAGGLAILTLPMSALFLCPRGWPRGIMAAYIQLLVLFGAGGLALHYAGDSELGLGMGALFLLGALLSSWVANVLMMFRPRQ